MKTLIKYIALDLLAVIGLDVFLVFFIVFVVMCWVAPEDRLSAVMMIAIPSYISFQTAYLLGRAQTITVTMSNQKDKNENL